jgi:Ser/Thr protein kinase RdoA (MazF antagonist)
MKRVHGPTMLDDLARRPWSMRSHARTLARLHKQLHEISAPSWLPAPLGEGNALLHLDLHPDNVILDARGPVVIDWPNAARGPSAVDVAHTWIVIACSVPTTGRFRQAATKGGSGLFVSLFLRHYDRALLEPHVAPVGRWRSSHRRLPDTEREAIGEMVERYG